MSVPVGLDFAQPVPDDGYVWWYVDALSTDGVHALTLIAFVGSVFSPYYRWARRRGPRAAEAHCALNVVLYGPRGRWCMTERGARDLRRAAAHFALGPSSLRWDGAQLVVEVAETSAPLPWPVRGRIVLRPTVLNTRPFDLCGIGRHVWQPIAPLATVVVDFTCPDLRWSGVAYLDTNRGSEPLERRFSAWEWSRSVEPERCLIYYDARTLDGEPTLLGLEFDAGGALRARPLPPRARLPGTRLWRMPRATRALPGAARVRRTLEDTPFYARSEITLEDEGRTITALHEALSLQRFSHPLVQCMLPFRMPRRA